MPFRIAPAATFPTRALALWTTAWLACATAAGAQTPDLTPRPGAATAVSGATSSEGFTAAPPLADPAPPPTHTTGILPAFIYGDGVFDAERPDFVATVRGGVRFGPAYFGSTKVKAGPDAAIRLDRVRLPGGLTFGSNEAVGFLRGFNPRLSGRIVPRRESNDY